MGIMTKKTRIFAALTMSVALMMPAAVSAQAAPVLGAGTVVSGPISQGGSNPGVSTAGMSLAFNDWVCRTLGALCR